MFHVHIITEGNPGIGDRRRSFRSYPQAKAYAEDYAWDHQWGTVIVDDVRDIADWGNEFTLADDVEATVAAPFYAQRLKLA